MNANSYEATIVNGQIRLPEHVRLPENSKVLVVIPVDGSTPVARLATPTLVHPEQMDEFRMTLGKAQDADL